MERLTKKLLNGNWNVNGCPWDKIPGEIYGALCKLKDYEDTGLTPDEITDGQMLTGWIPVDEQLPKLDEDGYTYVMVCMDDGFVATTNYTRDEGFSLWADSGEVLAWMPLPEPYKAE